MLSQSIQLSLLLHIQLPAWVSHTQTRRLIVAPCVECLGGWGRESSSALPLPHFLQASGIHWVGVRLLYSAAASWLGRRGETKGCSGIFTRGGSLATQRLLVFVFVCVSVESNWRRQGGVKRTPHFFFVFCLFWILKRLALFWTQSMCLCRSDDFEGFDFPTDGCWK